MPQIPQMPQKRERLELTRFDGHLTVADTEVFSEAIGAGTTAAS